MKGTITLKGENGESGGTFDCHLCDHCGRRITYMWRGSDGGEYCRNACLEAGPKVVCAHCHKSSKRLHHYEASGEVYCSDVCKEKGPVPLPKEKQGENIMPATQTAENPNARRKANSKKKSAKKAAKKAAKTPAALGRQSFSNDAKITVKNKPDELPFRGNRGDRFALVFKCKTVGDFRKKQGEKGWPTDLWPLKEAISRKHVVVEG